MNTIQVADQTETSQSSWRQAVAKYQSADRVRGLWQVANSIVPYFLMLYVMYRSLEVSYWLTLALSIVATGFLMRIFIMFHDCGHGSFFKSRKANEVLGIITGILTFTPFYNWRYTHAVHHATAGNLDKRGVGDVWTLTVKEYLALSPWRRLGYRFFRNPLVIFPFGAFFSFVISQRFAFGVTGKQERRSVYWTDLALLAIAVVASLTIGLKAYILIQLPIMVVASTLGVWLFYVQHQFEGVYWARHEKWDFVSAALKGSSFYRLPRVLQWFTGNIGFHHIHHLSPRIPNYYLDKCYRDNPMFQEVEPITLRSSLKSLGLRLWDEEQHKLVGFGYLSQRVPPAPTEVLPRRR